jgi:hypothetical protein
LIVYRLSPFRLLLIVNAAEPREGDYEWLKEREIAGSTCVMSPTSTRCWPSRGPALSSSGSGSREAVAFHVAEG